ncbi:hypothetical protein DIX61_00530 [Streptococcus iniae]|uniref:Uncharacterized protein n=1 Tax=Streptococcus iniae TaxID=1346 RepID=A0A3L8GRU2_STRIN|nr:hypothetical protein D5R92_06265 [Streptococcus iniae]AYB03870.1 hypothetical protein D5R90_06300 [Streptococcus iniae]RLU29421.1 hypothetical protein DIY15_00510 [Streptococcus iniae]RLU34059.1 hypothetical protein DIY14_00510 [Streptococcus iniae]RLU44430.1 hypothetical protein DIY10_00620 [Streptococcus iniae]
MGNSSISDEHVFFVALHFTTRVFSKLPIFSNFRYFLETIPYIIFMNRSSLYPFFISNKR